MKKNKYLIGTTLMENNRTYKQDCEGQQKSIKPSETDRSRDNALLENIFRTDEYEVFESSVAAIKGLGWFHMYELNAKPRDFSVVLRAIKDDVAKSSYPDEDIYLLDNSPDADCFNLIRLDQKLREMCQTMKIHMLLGNWLRHFDLLDGHYYEIEKEEERGRCGDASPAYYLSRCLKMPPSVFLINQVELKRTGDVYSSYYLPYGFISKLESLDDDGRLEWVNISWDGDFGFFDGGYDLSQFLRNYDYYMGDESISITIKFRGRFGKRGGSFAILDDKRISMFLEKGTTLENYL